MRDISVYHLVVKQYYLDFSELTLNNNSVGLSDQKKKKNHKNTLQYFNSIKYEEIVLFKWVEQL